jgi:hypothetical protein
MRGALRSVRDQARKGICMIGKWRLLIAIPAVAGLALTMGASAASAAPAHQISPARMVSSLADIPSAGAAKMVGGELELPAQTAATCAVVYIKGSGGVHLYLTAEGLNKVVEATSGSRDCWSTAKFGKYGEFVYTGSGRCLADNADLNRAVMQNCGGKSWQEWKPIPNSIVGLPGTSYINEYVYDQTHGKEGFLATNSLTSGTYVYCTGRYVDQWTEWYS